MKPIFKIQSDDRKFNLMQDRMVGAINDAAKNPLLSGQLLASVALANGTTTVDHKLNRTLRGWIVVRRSAQSRIYDTQATNQITDKTLVLVSDAAVTVDLFVF